VNIVARVSGGRCETGESALRRYLNPRRLSSNEFISSSTACRRRFRSSIELVPMKDDIDSDDKLHVLHLVTVVTRDKP